MEQVARLSDKSILNDSLATLKHLTENYNTAAYECSSQELRRDMLDIQREEHDNAFKVWNAMNARGWYQVQPADQQQISQLRQQFKAPGAGGGGAGGREFRGF